MHDTNQCDVVPQIILQTSRASVRQIRWRRGVVVSELVKINELINVGPG